MGVDKKNDTNRRPDACMTITNPSVPCRATVVVQLGMHMLRFWHVLSSRHLPGRNMSKHVLAFATQVHGFGREVFGSDQVEELQ